MTDTAPVIETLTPPVVQETAPVLGNDTDLPEWARTKLSEANAEAAKYRTQKNEALSAAKATVEAEYAQRFTETGERITELEFELSERGVRLAKLEAILNAGIPSDAALDFASLVQGSTAEEITASVEKIKGLYSRDPRSGPLVDPTQTKGGAPLPLNGDPLMNSLKQKLGIN